MRFVEAEGIPSNDSRLWVNLDNVDYLHIRYVPTTEDERFRYEVVAVFGNATEKVVASKWSRQEAEDYVHRTFVAANGADWTNRIHRGF